MPSNAIRSCLVYKVELLSPSHDRKSFDCGTHPALNIFLQQQARQQGDKGISRTFVLINDVEPSHIIGYFSLILTEVSGNRLPEALAKKYPRVVAGVKLARLAVDRAHQRQGFGAVLLIEAMSKALIISENAGVIGLFVDAKDNSAKEYYLQYGFEALQDNDLEMFLPLSLVQQMLSSQE